MTDAFEFFNGKLSFESCLYDDMSRHMGKPTICIGENKGADQLRGDC